METQALVLLGQSRGYQQGGEMGGGMLVFLVVYLAIVVVNIVAMWRVFTKAGQPGWGIFVPFYNIYLMLKIAGRPGWWLILAFIPLVNLILIVIPFDIARNFGKGGGFGLGLLLLGFIFYPILAFSDAQYQPVSDAV
jgi:uncharacterized membrane protein YhaH (DUF805 family)